MNRTFRILALYIVNMIMCTFLSCNKIEPVSLSGGEGSIINIYYPMMQKYSITLQGGDGHYTVSCDRPDIIKVEMTSGINVDLNVLSLGDAVLTVCDRSSHFLELNIHVDYLRHKMRIVNYRIDLAGDLTAEEKSSLRTEALRTIPVNTGGGYEFVFLEKDRGTVSIYPDKFGENGTEYDFEAKSRSEVSPSGTTVNTIAYYVSFNGSTRVFKLITAYNAPVLSEELTDSFRVAYPNLEYVYAFQEIEIPQR